MEKINTLYDPDAWPSFIFALKLARWDADAIVSLGEEQDPVVYPKLKLYRDLGILFQPFKSQRGRASPFR